MGWIHSIPPPPPPSETVSPLPTSEEVMDGALDLLHRLTIR